jgi:taurine dioxygenase
MPTMQIEQTKHAPDCQKPTDFDRQFEVIPLNLFGAEIVGFKFSREIDTDQILALRTALIEHKMLVLRDQCLSPEEQMALTKLFGHELHRAGPSLRHLPDHPEIFRIANRPGEGNPNTGHYWHCDGHYLADPSAVTVMHIVNATTDGATHVTDLSAAYNRLPDTTKQYLSHHGFFATETGVAHAIVRKHPLTGRHGLYVNLKAIAVDRCMRQIPQVNELIHECLSQTGTFYEHQWKHGDTLIVDNFATAHRGTLSNPENLRVLHRTTVTGPSVWWRIKR